MKLRNILLSLVSILFVSSCASSVPDFRVGKTYYTQFSIRFEGDRYYSTGYQRGQLLPINSSVTIDKINEKIIAVTLPSGQKLSIINMKKHTSESVDDYFGKIFDDSLKNLSKFSKLEKEAILKGEIKNGMRKDAVIAAVGYPPKIATSSVDDNEWTYWQSKFSKYRVVFKNGKVTNFDKR